MLKKSVKKKQQHYSLSILGNGLICLSAKCLKFDQMFFFSLHIQFVHGYPFNTTINKSQQTTGNHIYTHLYVCGGSISSGNTSVVI